VYAWRKDRDLLWYFTYYKDDAGLATVMGHEVSHALANHGAQRMSGQLQQVIGAGVSVATRTK
jgi:predicted Zn-dependent protease